MHICNSKSIPFVTDILKKLEHLFDTVQLVRFIVHTVAPLKALNIQLEISVDQGHGITFTYQILI